MIHAWLGIDPGASGAVALLNADGAVIVEDFTDVSAAADLLREWTITHTIMLAVLELASARPGQGVRSVFAFGTRFGEWCGLLSGLSVPYQIVPPQRWQKGTLLPSDGKDSKERSLTAARRLFPGVDLSRKRDHNRADALGLALFAKRSEGGL